MSDWTMVCWHGPPATMLQALRDLGWYAPDDPQPAATDPRIGGFIPPPGTELRLFDGVAYAALVADAALETPAGLSETGRQLSAALLGSF